WWAMVSAEKLLAIASQPFTTAPPWAQISRSLFGLMGCAVCSAVHAGPLGVEGPVRDQVLHDHGVVARAQAVLLVEPVGFLHLGHVQFDAQAGLLRHGHMAVDDLQRL